MADCKTQPRKSLHRIGVIADTHNRWSPRIAEIFAEVTEIWHLGDCCDERSLDPLREITGRLVVVLGNNDFGLKYPLALRLERGGERFFLTHILPQRLPEDTDWVLFGHTHRPIDAVEESLHLFNPGSSGKANKGAPASVGLLTQYEGGSFAGEIVLL